MGAGGGMAKCTDRDGGLTLQAVGGLGGWSGRGGFSELWALHELRRVSYREKHCAGRAVFTSLNLTVSFPSAWRDFTFPETLVSTHNHTHIYTRTHTNAHAHKLAEIQSDIKDTKKTN